MKKYKNTEPVFSEEIDIYEDTDPVDAETVDNVPLKQLADNDNALKKQIDGFSLETENNIKALADELMSSAYTGDGTDIGGGTQQSGGINNGRAATEEEVGDIISGFDDILG